MSQDKTVIFDKGESFTLILRPLPGWGVPGIQRLRAALKCLLRSFGLRCIDVRENATSEPVEPHSECEDG